MSHDGHGGHGGHEMAKCSMNVRLSPALAHPPGHSNNDLTHPLLRCSSPGTPRTSASYSARGGCTIPPPSSAPSSASSSSPRATSSSASWRGGTRSGPEPGWKYCIVSWQTLAHSVRQIPVEHHTIFPFRLCLHAFADALC